MSEQHPEEHYRATNPERGKRAKLKRLPTHINRYKQIIKFSSGWDFNLDAGKHVLEEQ